MKIAVILATRGRPQRAAGVIECARNLMSGQHAVEFVVAVDDDDTGSRSFFTDYDGARCLSFPRPAGVGDCWNRAARQCEADIYVPITDDAWIAAPFWDLALVDVLEREPLCRTLGIVGWMDLANPTHVTLFGMTPDWIARNGGIVFDPRFAFWWADTALVEIAIFATGEGMPQSDALRFVTKPGVFNPRLRDMELWWDLFAATRAERVETARRVCMETGLPFPAPDHLRDLLNECAARDAQGRRNAAGVLASIERPTPPDRAYEHAKAAAQAHLTSMPSKHRHYPAVMVAAGFPEGPHP